MLIFSSGVQFFTVSVFPPSNEPDVVGYIMCAVSESDIVDGDFTPSADNMINIGPETSYTCKVPIGGNYHVKAAAFDSFEDPNNIDYGSLNWTPIYTVLVSMADPTDTIPPDTPTGLTLGTGLDSTQGRQDLTYISATWTKPADPVSDLAGYSVQLKKGSETTYVEITVNSNDTLSAKFGGLVANTSYSVRVAAFDKWGNISAYSSWVSTTTAKDATIPADVVLSSVTSAFKNVFITWAATVDTDIAYYQVDIATDSGFTTGLRTFKVSGTNLSIDAVSGSTYYARVKAVDYSGNISVNYSNVLNTTTALVTGTDIANLTLTATNIANGSIDLGGTKITGLLANTNLSQITDATKIADSLIGNSKLAALAVDAGKLADSAVTSTKIANAAVGTAAIANAAVTTALIANLAVGTAQIADAAITNAKIGNLAVGTAQIADAAITNAKIGNLAVNTGNIVDAAISNAKIANLAVDYTKIADATITTAKIGDLQVTSAKINDLAVGKLTSGAISASTSITAGTVFGNGKYPLTIDGSLSNIRVNDGTYDRVTIGKNGVKYGIEITDSTGTSIFDANGNVNGARVTNLTVNGNAVVAGAVTIGAASITYTGGATVDSLKPAASGATKNVVTYASSAPSSPTDGDIWVDTSVNPNVTRVRISGAWQVSANYVTNTNQVTDGAGLGTTAVWSSVSGTGKPADNADVTSTAVGSGSLTIGAALTINNYLSITGNSAKLITSGRGTDDTAFNLSGSAGIAIGKDSSGNPNALFYKDTSNYLKYDTTNGVQLRGPLNASDINTGILSSRTLKSGRLLQSGTICTNAMSGSPIGTNQTVQVEDTSDFASSGTAYLLYNYSIFGFTYTGKTTTTLTGCDLSAFSSISIGQVILAGTSNLLIDSFSKSIVSQYDANKIAFIGYDGYEVIKVTSDTDAILGVATGSTGNGITGRSTNRYGVEAESGYLSGTWHDGTGAPLRLKPSTSSSAPSHSADIGALWVTSTGVLYINTSSPSPGTTWTKVGAQ